MLEDSTQPPTAMVRPMPAEPEGQKLHPIIKKLKNKETGLGLAVYMGIKSRHPNNPLKQAAAFFSEFTIPAATGRKRAASDETQNNYQERINTLIHTLGQINMPIRNLDEVTKKQVRHFFQHMERQGRSTSWMANVNTAVRRFGTWIGKPELCPPLGQLTEKPWSSVKRVAAERDRSWGALEEGAFEDTLRKVAEHCPTTALQLRLAALFGHRVTEFLMFKPANCLQGDYLHLKEGTKGGRTRMVPVETQEQKRWLEVAIQEASTNRQGRLQYKEGITLEQARNHLQSILRLCGLTKDQTGLTVHGLRHSYACNLYREFTGEPAPIQGGGIVDAELDRRARREISLRLGHGRISVTTSYLGSHAALKKYAKENLQRIEYLVKHDNALQALMKGARFDSLCLVGPIARGDTLPKNQSSVLAYAATIQPNETRQQADIRLGGHVMAICEQLSQTLGRLITAARLNALQDAEDRFELA